MSGVSRIRLLSLGFGAFALLLIVRLYMVQIVSGQEFKDRADRQYSSPTQRVFDRGTIYFQSKDSSLISAAMLKSGYTLSVNPTLIQNPELTYKSLSTALPLDREVFLERASKKNDPYEEIVHRVTEEEATAIENLKLAGVRLFKERWRYYPGGPLAAQTIGFMGYKGDEFSGRYGLENQYNTLLQRDSKNVYVNFFAEIFANVNKTLFYSAEGEGNIVTTIEPNVQLALEKELKDITVKYRSKSTGAIIIDPKTGAIYAMGSYPTYDPNFFQIEKDVAIYTNPLVQNVYEMGSIIKPLTVAAGIDAGVVTPTTTYDDKGQMTFNNRTFYNYDKRARGVVSMQEVLNQSLNTGVAFVEQKMGNQRFTTYFDKLFEQKTGIDLPGEPNNLISNLHNDRDIDHATAAFGQGMAVTPIATARALSAMANGGYLVTPHIVQKIEYTSGFSKTPTFPKGEQVFNPETSKMISRMLTTVVDKALLEGSVKQEHYSVAAKTGTAQIVRPGTNGYYEDRYNHTFFGYFPSYDPKFLILIYTIEPQGEQYASHTLTQPFMNMVQFLINYYDVPPDR